MVSTAHAWSLTLSRAELFMIAYSLSSRPALGVPDPFVGLSGDAMQHVVEDARHALLDRGYAEAAPNGSLAVDPVVLALAGAPGMAHAVLVASRGGEGGRVAQRVVYLSPELIVEQEHTADDTVRLTAVRDARTLQTRLNRLLSVPKAPPAAGGEVVIGQEELKEAVRLAMLEEPPAVVEFLTSAGLDAAAATAVVAVLARECQTGSLALLRTDGQEPAAAGGVAWLAGKAGLWSADLSGHPDAQTIHLVPAASAEVRQRVAATVNTAVGADAPTIPDGARTK